MKLVLMSSAILLFILLGGSGESFARETTRPTEVEKDSALQR
jgi:hypothetical protein